MINKWEFDFPIPPGEGPLLRRLSSVALLEGGSGRQEASCCEPKLRATLWEKPLHFTVRVTEFCNKFLKNQNYVS